MDLERMLDKCRRGQWKVDDLDWSVAPRPMAPEVEIAVVQYFTDMAGIERLAGALFEEQRRRTDDPVLGKIFATFVADEQRHAVVAERLARHYDVHHYRDYRQSPHLTRFAPVFLEAIQHVSAEIANVYITTGELLLDVALLRSIDDYVDDEMSRRAMTLINRDESRHIAIDYYMVEYYASPAYQAWLARQPRRTARQWARAARAFVAMLYLGAPFARDVFLAPMEVVDPGGTRLREAFRRVQMIGRKPEVARRPFTRFGRAVQLAYNAPIIGTLFGGVISRIGGVPGEVIADALTPEDERRIQSMTLEEMAAEALAVKEQDRRRAS